MLHWVYYVIAKILCISHLYKFETKLYFEHNINVICILRVLESLKSHSHLPKIDSFPLMQSFLKIIKNTSYFILKALFVLKIFKFLFWRFGNEEKNGLIRKTNFKIYDLTTWLTNDYNTHIVQYLIK